MLDEVINTSVNEIGEAEGIGKSLCEQDPAVGDVGARYSGGDPRREDETGANASEARATTPVELGGAATNGRSF